MDNYGTATLTDCTITANHGASVGGGLVNRGTVTLTDCTLSGNSAGDDRGGVDNYGTATLADDCTLSGNSAGDGRGGGVYNLRHGDAHRLHAAQRQLRRQRRRRV